MVYTGSFSEPNKLNAFLLEWQLLVDVNFQWEVLFVQLKLFLLGLQTGRLACRCWDAVQPKWIADGQAIYKVLQHTFMFIPNSCTCTQSYIAAFSTGTV